MPCIGAQKNKIMEINTIYKEPCLETLRRMPDNFLDCVITSPPYWQLRDYGYSGQWGLEPTFQMYLENLWEMMTEVKRVLKPTGTAWINLGDTYGTQSGGMRAAQDNFESKESKYGAYEKVIEQPKSLHKCLLLIPHRFAIGCIDLGFIIRNDIVWAKRNGMPESVTDRFSKKHEYFFFMVKSENYFFNLDAVRDKTINTSIIRNKANEKYAKASIDERQYSAGERNWVNEKGKNPGSVSDFWDIPTKPSSNEHYASYNDALIKKPILSGCPEGGLIYDPFMGTGSTAEAAIRANRNFIGSEMSEKYIEIANKRLLPFLTQEKLF